MNAIDPYARLESLLDLAEQVGLTVRQVSGTAETDHPGGALVRLKGSEVLFLDPAAAVADQLAVTARALRGRRELSGRFIAPELRELIDGSQ